MLQLGVSDEGRQRVIMFFWRKHGYIENNILMLNAALMLMGLAVFALHPDEIGDRMSHTMSVLFGCVALRLVVDTVLPQLEFNTFVQTQLNLSIYFLCSSVLETAVLHFLHRRLDLVADAFVARVDGGCGVLLLLILGRHFGQMWMLRSEHMQRQPKIVY